MWTTCSPLIGSDVDSFVFHQPVMEDHHTTWFTNVTQNTAIGGSKKYKYTADPQSFNFIILICQIISIEQKRVY